MIETVEFEKKIYGKYLDSSSRNTCLHQIVGEKEIKGISLFSYFMVDKYKNGEDVYPESLKKDIPFINGYCTDTNEFIVVEQIGLSSHIYSYDKSKLRPYLGYMNIKVNNTTFFMNPDGSLGGIPNMVIPFPIDNPILDSKDFLYVLPGQFWEVHFETSDIIDSNEYIIVYIRYTSYTGRDAIMADNNLRCGVSVEPDNVKLLMDMVADRKEHIKKMKRD